ncbi:MAG: chemotaxis protein CheA [Nitrospirae bacterium]|nr:chemotaxis protein CheA [Nitrospirota bacterium]NTW65859.1 chemotaxis protein CheA [Nitrospirota bacterium]
MKSDRPIQEFLAEAEDILETANQALMSLDDAKGGGRANPDTVNGLFRALHSFKGLAGMFGLKVLADLSHKLEFLLDEVRLGKVSLGQETLDALSDTLGLLGRLVQQTGKGLPLEDIAGALDRIDRILAAKSADAAGPTLLSQIAIDPAVLQVLTEYEEHRLTENVRERKNLFLVRVSFSFAAFESGIRTLTETLKNHGEIICTLPTASAGGDGIGFTIMLGTSATREVLAAATNLPNTSFEAVPRMDDSRMQDVRPEMTTLKTVSNTVRVDIHKLDSLMSSVGELHIIKSEIGRIALDLRGQQGFTGIAVTLTKAYKNLERRLNEIQEGILDVRMVPIGQIFTRLAQTVRKYAREAGKEIDLEIRGEETELDKLMVEDLADPLMHLIRNAIDHGIAKPDVRKLQGKPERGLVRLTAFPTGNHVVITVEDDGGGIDPLALLAKAREKGLVEDELDAERDRKEVLDLIFLPGFTTSETVTEISGRGVGMDVVKRNVSRLSGMIDIETETGVGTTFILTLPITLAIIKALIIEASGRRFAVPLGSVLEVMRVRPEQIETIETREVMAIRDETVPLLRLSDAFSLPQADRPETHFVVLVGLAERKLGLVVDRLRGQQEIVIKPLGSRLADTPGIAGATELGDKIVVLVLDVESLIEGTLKKTASRFQG